MLLLELDGCGDDQDGCYICEMDTPIIFCLLEKGRGKRSITVMCNVMRGAVETLCGEKWHFRFFIMLPSNSTLFCTKKCQDFHWYSLCCSSNQPHIHTFCFLLKSMWHLLCIELPREPRLYLLLHLTMNSLENCWGTSPFTAYIMTEVQWTAFWNHTFYFHTYFWGK